MVFLVLNFHVISFCAEVLLLFTVLISFWNVFVKFWSDFCSFLAVFTNADRKVFSLSAVVTVALLCPL